MTSINRTTWSACKTSIFYLSTYMYIYLIVSPRLINIYGEAPCDAVVGLASG